VVPIFVIPLLQITITTRNATKFTHEGGRIKVVTKLLWPKLPHPHPRSERGTYSPVSAGTQPQTPAENVVINGDLNPVVEATETTTDGAMSTPGTGGPPAFTEDRLHAHDLAAAEYESIVVRIEVHE
jgi:hypothetical protein